MLAPVRGRRRGRNPMPAQPFRGVRGRSLDLGGRSERPRPIVCQYASVEGRFFPAAGSSIPPRKRGSIVSNLRLSFLCAAFVLVAGLGFASVFGMDDLGGAHASSAPTPGVGLYSLGSQLANVGNPNAYSVVIGGTADYDELATLPGTSLAYFSGTDVNTAAGARVSPTARPPPTAGCSPTRSGNLLVNQGYPEQLRRRRRQPRLPASLDHQRARLPGSQPGHQGRVHRRRPLRPDPAGRPGGRQVPDPAGLGSGAALVRRRRRPGAAGARATTCSSTPPATSPATPASDDGSNTITWWQEARAPTSTG